MNFYSWLYGGDSLHEKVAEDAENPEFEQKHPRESKGGEGGGRFKTSPKTVESQDDILPPSYEDLQRIYEEKGVCDELLDAADELFHGIVKGTVKPKRMPKEAFDTEAAAKLPKWLMAGYLVGTNYGDHEAKCKEVLLDFAKSAGVYKEDMYREYRDKYGDVVGDGMEAFVYNRGDGRVAKVSTLGIAGGNLARVERLMLSNHYFPETAYEVDGLGTQKTGELVFGLHQPFIDFDDTEMEEDEVQKWVENRGRGWKVGDSWTWSYVSKGNDLACLDMHGKNVVRTKDGTVVCLDPCVVPNHYDLMVNGHYNYDDPPDRFE